MMRIELLITMALLGYTVNVYAERAETPLSATGESNNSTGRVIGLEIIKVDKGSWGSLKPSHQDRITAILKESGLLNPDGKVILDPRGESITGKPSRSLGIPPEVICENICSTAERGYVKGCQKLYPVAARACQAPAEAAGAACRNECLHSRL
ncbi:MAG: hypothetical protein PHF56_02635 [Desulfuromonadaceae bacterium]|nr:hypothetical protein [Desulfuromonadaceae bacterium]